jgi:hypothetical protein
MCQSALDCRRLAGEDYRSAACSKTVHGVCFAGDTAHPPEVPSAAQIGGYFNHSGGVTC